MPVPSVRHGVDAVEFDKRAFGAVEIMGVTAPDGAVVADLAIGGESFSGCEIYG